MINRNELQLPSIQGGGLDNPFTEEEIWNAIKAMPPEKAPGPDDFNSIFFRACWSTIKHDILAAFHQFHCNTPDVTYLICTPTLAVSGAKLFYFLGFGFLSPCVVVVVMHLISCHHVHCICIRVCLMHPNIFPIVRFAFRHFYVLRWSFLPLFMCGG